MANEVEVAIVPPADVVTTDVAVVEATHPVPEQEVSGDGFEVSVEKGLAVFDGLEALEGVKGLAAASPVGDTPLVGDAGVDAGVDVDEEANSQVVQGAFVPQGPSVHPDQVLGGQPFVPHQLVHGPVFHAPDEPHEPHPLPSPSPKGPFSPCAPGPP